MKKLALLALLATPLWCQFSNAKKLQGVPVGATAPSDGQALCFDAASSSWLPATSCLNAGVKGDAGTNGKGYLATSTTSLATAGSGSKSFTTQSGLAYTVGARIRATAAASGEYMEGLVTSYSSTTLVATMDLNSGTGTHTDWNINLAGNRGAVGADGATGATGATGADGTGATANQNIRTVTVSFDGGDVPLSGGATRCVPIVPTGTLQTVRLQACNAYTSSVCSAGGSATVDIRTASNSSYASTGPSAASTIKSTGSLLSISSAYAADGVLTNWTTSSFGAKTVCVVMSAPTAMTVDVIMGILAN